jgi:hypothetical protein
MPPRFWGIPNLHVVPRSSEPHESRGVPEPAWEIPSTAQTTTLQGASKVGGYSNQRAMERVRGGQPPGPEMSLSKMSLTRNMRADGSACTAGSSRATTAGDDLVEGDLVPCAVPIAEYFFVGIDPTGRRGHPGRAGRTRAGRRPRRGARSRRRASVRHVRVVGDGLNRPPRGPGGDHLPLDGSSSRIEPHAM